MSSQPTSGYGHGLQWIHPAKVMNKMDSFTGIYIISLHDRAREAEELTHSCTVCFKVIGSDWNDDEEEKALESYISNRSYCRLIEVGDVKASHVAPARIMSIIEVNTPCDEVPLGNIPTRLS